MNNPVSQLKGMDLVRWLDNKLGNPNELWCGRQASSVLSREILNELSTCFQALEPHVKLKIVEAIPHLSPKLIQMWRDPLTKLLDIAKDDADNWIRTIAKMYIHYPTTGAINCDITDLDKQFADTANDFQRILDTTIPKLECNIIPPDSLIVTPAATQMAFGYSSSEPKRNFTLRKPLKSEQMLQDALRLAQTTHNQVKRSTPGVTSSSLPIRVRSTIRKPDNTLPMRGIPSIPASRISSGFTNEPKKFQRHVTKREGGAVLIDISDLPEAPTLKKRRGPPPSKPPKADVDPTKESKKRGGGRKPKNQEPAITESMEMSVPQSNEEEANNEMVDNNVPAFSPTLPTPIGTRKLENMMDGGAFSFI